jgi:hypothetical protein
MDAMWWTPSGERALRGAEWEIFRESLHHCWDWVEESLNDPDLFTTGVDAFDKLQPSQRLALLALVGNALKDETEPHPELTAHTEATVAAIFSHITAQVAIEIEAASEPEAQEDPTFWRTLVLAAYREAAEQESLEEQALAAETGDVHAHCSPLIVESEEVEDDAEAWLPPSADSESMDDWEYLIEYLANRILWEDGDYEMGDAFLDADPSEREIKMTLMGIDEDYYTAIAPDPTNEELGVIRQQLRAVCSGPGSAR